MPKKYVIEAIVCQTQRSTPQTKETADNMKKAVEKKGIKATIKRI